LETSLQNNFSQSKKGTGPPVKHKTIGKNILFEKAHGPVPLRNKNSKSLLYG